MPRQPGLTPEKISRMRHDLREWYDRNKRDLPWRHSQDPYAIWVSEIMLQQTRVAVVTERYKSFLQRFPTIHALAAAEEQDVLALWSGLGYYRRARMLHKAAQTIVAEGAGKMPVTSQELRKLPGIGSYTAAAIASIAHNEAVAVVDGNVERVLSRIRGWESHDAATESAVRRKVEEFAAILVDPRYPGDFNQAIMELGATTCTPRNPQCLACPWSAQCHTLGEHRTPKRAAMTTRAVACSLAVRERSNRTEVLLEQRPATSTVMPCLWELPMHEASHPATGNPIFTVRHSIMQVNYRVQVYAVPSKAISTRKTGHLRRWIPVTNAATMALTGLARKVLTKAGLLSFSRNSSAMFADTMIAEVL